jgi:hypothetical protein
MRDLLDPTLLAAVLTSREEMDVAQTALVDARARLWRAARDAGHEPTSHRIGELQILPDQLLEVVADRTDRAAEALRTAFLQLSEAEAAATRACDAAGRAMRDLRSLLPPAYRTADLVERAMGRAGRQYHRVFVLEAGGAPVHTSGVALCGRKRSYLWRSPARRPLASELCRSCQRSKAASETDEVQPDAAASRLRRFRLPDRAALRRAFPVISLFGAMVLAAGLLQLVPVADHPLVQLVLGAVTGPALPG